MACWQRLAVRPLLQDEFNQANQGRLHLNAELRLLWSLHHVRLGDGFAKPAVLHPYSERWHNKVDALGANGQASGPIRFFNYL